MNWKVCLSDIDFGPEELESVAAVLGSKWLSMGERTHEFEARFANYLGVRHAFLVSSGTAALHLANLVVGVGPGDEVILPSLTFVATANATVYCGATPVFADVVGPDDLNVSPDDIRGRITERTKAITVVHYGGYPADMDAICRIAREHDLRIIEDAAHAPGASLDGRMLGGIGDVGCFSFFSNKNLVTGEGGAIVTSNDEYAERIRLMRSHGMTTLSYERHKGHAYSYDVLELGYNYRATEITAAIATAQLKKLDRNNQRRRRLAELYREYLTPVEHFRVPFADGGDGSSCHLMPALLPHAADRRAVMARLREDGIQTSIHYPPIHQFQWHRNRCRSLTLPVTEDVAAREITLPLHPLMRDQDVSLVCQQLVDAVLASRPAGTC
jgi:dTDP-4-amino-4,6-dideoxygalactose transaminase